MEPPHVDLRSIQTTWSCAQGNNDEQKAAQFFLVKDKDGNITLEKKPEGAWNKFCHFFYRLTHKQKYNILDNAQTLKEACTSHSTPPDVAKIHNAIIASVASKKSLHSKKKSALEKLRIEPPTTTPQGLPSGSQSGNTGQSVESQTTQLPQSTSSSGTRPTSASTPIQSTIATSEAYEEPSPTKQNKGLENVPFESPTPLAQELPSGSQSGNTRQPIEPQTTQLPQSTSSPSVPHTPKPTPTHSSIPVSTPTPEPTVTSEPQSALEPEHPATTAPVTTPDDYSPPSTEGVCRIDQPAAYPFTYAWDFKNPSGVNVDTLSPTELLSYSAKGGQVSGEQFMNAASNFKQTLKPEDSAYSQSMTTLHELFEKAADAFTREGNIEAAFQARARAATEAVTTPRLLRLGATIETVQAQGSSQLQAYIGNLDSGTLKRGEIKADKRIIDGEKKVQINFRLSRPARHKLQETLHTLTTHTKAFIEQLPDPLKGSQMTIEEIDDGFLRRDERNEFHNDDHLHISTDQHGKALAIRIKFEGIGEIIVGNSPAFGCLHESVRILIDDTAEKNEETSRAHAMLSMLGLGPILTEQRDEDKERIKLAQLFRTFYPREAIQMERSKEFYELSCMELEENILKACPQMEEIITAYHESPSNIEEIELQGGRKVFSIPRVAEELQQEKTTKVRMRDQKATVKHLMHTITGNQAQRCERISRMLRHGLVSTLDRYQSGLIAPGASSSEDLASGGGGFVFTRVLTTLNEKQLFSEKSDLGEALLSDYAFFFDLQATTYGAFGYEGDEFGVRNPEAESYKKYEERNSITELCTQESVLRTLFNEVMVPGSIPPHFIQHIVCRTDEAREALITKLTDDGLIENGLIRGRPVDKFIYVIQQE